MRRGAPTWVGFAGLLSLLALAPVARPAMAVDLFRIENGQGAVIYTNIPPEPAGVSLLPPPAPPPAAPRPPAPEPEPSPTAARAAAGPHGAVIRAAALRHGVDERLVHAIVRVESAGNPRAVSRKGALGLMQLMPDLAVRMNVRDPFDPDQNVSAGVRHLQHLLSRYAGRLDLALAAYNAGEEAVRLARGIPPYPETRQYVQAVLQHYGRSGKPTGLAGDGPADPAAAAPAARPLAPPATAPLPPPPSPEVFYQYVLPDGTILLTNIPRSDGG